MFDPANNLWRKIHQITHHYDKSYIIFFKYIPLLSEYYFVKRSNRLITLMQLLRSYRYPVSAQNLVQELDISVRTLYRDIELLREQGANIQGEAGLGYVLIEDLALPPLQLDHGEIEALVLGLRWVCRHSDEHLVKSAKNLFHKIQHVLPSAMQEALHNSPMLVGSEYRPQQGENHFTQLIRQAIQDQSILNIEYIDGKKEPSERRIYPLALAYFNEVRLLLGWCEKRHAFRSFRIDRIQQLHNTLQNYQPNRAFLLQQWFNESGISNQDFYFD